MIPSGITAAANKLRGNSGGSSRSKSNTLAGDIIPKGYVKGQLQQFDPQQMELYQNTFGHLGPESYLSRLAGGDENLFNEIEAPALRQFNDISANIANKYSAGRSIGGRRSSGFQNEQTAAGSNFAQQLQANRQGLMRQALQDLMNYSNTLLNQRPYDQFLAQKPQKQPGFAGQLGQGLTSLAGGALGSLTGPLGTAAGSSVGNFLGEKFFG